MKNAQHYQQLTDYARTCSRFLTDLQGRYESVLDDRSAANDAAALSEVNEVIKMLVSEVSQLTRELEVRTNSMPMTLANPVIKPKIKYDWPTPKTHDDVDAFLAQAKVSDQIVPKPGSAGDNARSDFRRYVEDFADAQRKAQEAERNQQFQALMQAKMDQTHLNMSKQLDAALMCAPTSPKQIGVSGLGGINTASLPAWQTMTGVDDIGAVPEAAPVEATPAYRPDMSKWADAEEADPQPSVSADDTIKRMGLTLQNRVSAKAKSGFLNWAKAQFA
jgi:hypothetical protein